jgi:hypothetical protein
MSLVAADFRRALLSLKLENDRDCFGFFHVVGLLGTVGEREDCGELGWDRSVAVDGSVMAGCCCVLLGPELDLRKRLWLLLFRRDLNIPHHAAIRDEAAAVSSCCECGC